MLSFTASLKIYVAVEPCDMRKSFEGLSALTTTALNQDVRNGALFVFSNERRNRLKILYWDGTGIWVMAKRLEKGTFSWPEGEEKSHSASVGSPGHADRRGRFTGAKMRPWYDRGD
ncbi:MAG: IS66 family insertion sequence element accessory protein TnpB [Verrucomicrobiota bacterium]